MSGKHPENDVVHCRVCGKIIGYITEYEDPWCTVYMHCPECFSKHKSGKDGKT